MLGFWLIFSSVSWAKNPEVAVEKRDSNGDGRVSIDEWEKSSFIFDKIDFDGDGYLTAAEFAQKWGMPISDTYNDDIVADQVSRSELTRQVFRSFGRRMKNPFHAIERGMIPTGLTPKFDERVNCRGIDHYWAMDYSGMRGVEAYHGGIDIPAPQGTPILAIANGVVVAKFMNEQSAKGIEIILRHSPQDTGLNIWVYTKYTHFVTMPVLNIGRRVSMGEVIGKTGNSGLGMREVIRRNLERFGNGKNKEVSRWGGKQKKAGQRSRRHLLHFAVLYSTSRKYMNKEGKLIPVDGYWMDPNGLYRQLEPFDSISLKALSENQKQIAIPYMTSKGEFVPADTKIIWPYSCSER
jgi:murein DD-endopeptidase MepM/ murein hydrolase activator NlpD